VVTVLVVQSRLAHGSCGSVTARGDRKREYYFLEGMTFPAETVIYIPEKTLHYSLLSREPV
jgi:hypothetical protein